LLATMLLHGAMQTLDVQLSALALQAFAPGLAGWVLVKVLAPAYFSRQDTKTPLRFAAVAVAVNIALNLALFQIMGHVGLALATSASGLVNAGLLALGLSRSGYLVADKQTWRILAKALLGCLLMGLVLVMIAPADEYWLRVSVIDRIGWLALLVALGGGTYAFAVLLLGIRPRHLRLTL